MTLPAGRYSLAPSIGGHSFRIAGEVHEEHRVNTAGCTNSGCHAEMKQVTDTHYFDKRAAADYDGDGKTETVQEEVIGLLDRLINSKGTGLLQTIRLTARSLAGFGIAAPRIGVAGLNPHAGEHGLFGREDDDVMRPAIQAAAAEGIAVSGPFPADTLFVRAARGEFDVVIAAYHDQGLVPVKLLAFGRAVNVTLGLPIVRTSVDHGTAFDIARQGIADEGSLVEAILLATRLA